MSNGTLEICAAMVICTSHIDAETRDVLTKWESAYSDWSTDHWISKLNGGPTTYGYFFRARPEDMAEETPRCIRDAIEYAHARGISWVHYDVDAGEAPDLKVYED